MGMNVVITGADRGLGLELVKQFLGRGCRVFAGQFMMDWHELSELKKEFDDQLDLFYLDVGSNESVNRFMSEVSEKVECLDVLVNNAGIHPGNSEFGAPVHYDALKRTYNINSIGPLRVTKAFLPLLDKGKMKRLCFVSSESGSITLMHRTGDFGYCMTKTALNMGVRMMHNHLQVEGYTFRLYQPGWMKSFMGGDKSETGDLEPYESAEFAVPFFMNDLEDESRLVLIDNNGRELSF